MAIRQGSPYARRGLATGVLPTLGVALVLACNRQPAASADASTPAPNTAPAADAAPAASPSEPSEPSDPSEAGKSGARTWTFDDAPAGSIPPGFRTAETGGQGNPATWKTVADPAAPTPPQAFGITESRNDKRTYNIAIIEQIAQADVDLSVMVRANGGELNQGGGPIWRVKDPDNYYIARWDPVEDNAYLYVMQGGHRSALATVDIELDHDAWHTLRVVMEGAHMELFIDDEPVLEADDTALIEPGGIGLWTKSDATTLFDDLSLTSP